MIDLPPPDPAIELSIASHGMSKGTAQTEGAQLLVRPQLSFGPAYVSAYAKNVDPGESGWETGVGAGIVVDQLAIRWTGGVTLKKMFGISGPIDDEAVELTFGASRKFGPVTALAVAYVSPDELGATKQSLYGEAGATFTLTPSTAFTATIGKRLREGGPDYRSLGVGLSQAIVKGLKVELRYYDTNRSELGRAYKGRLVAALRTSL